MSLLSRIRDRLFGDDAPPVDPAARALVEQLAAEIRAAGIRETRPPDTFAAGRLLLDGGPAERVERVRALLDERQRTQGRLRGSYNAQNWAVRGVLDTALKRLLRPRQPYTQLQLAELLRLAATTFTLWGSWEFPLGSLLNQIAAARDGAAIDRELRRRLKDVRGLVARHDRLEHRRMIAQIDAVLRGNDDAPPLTPDGPAGAGILGDIQRLPEAPRTAWTALLRHGLEIRATTPTAEWLTRARALVETISEEEFTRAATGWLAAGPAPGAPRTARATDADADLLKGLVWAASTVDSPALAVAVGDFAVACFRKIPGEGPVSKKAGNACLGALGGMRGLDGVAQLGRVRTAVKYTEAHRMIDKAIAAAAKRTGLAATDLEDLAVPTFGFGEDGVRRQSLGAATAELAISGSADVDLTWIAPNGRRQASVPADVRTAHRDAVSELRKTAQDAARMLHAQRDRIETLFLAPRSWEGVLWRERYLAHPLLAGMSRRLIWRLQRRNRTLEAIWFDGRLVDIEDRPVVADDARVSLWHPLDGDIGTVTAWRRWLEKHEVTQPFKQAHREVYLLTHAERETATYSNRFAAHVLRQHQFAALCRQRGWRYTLQGLWDSHNVPVRDLPGGALRAEFWVEPPPDSQVSQMGVQLQLVTDQVRFVDVAGTPQPLADVPPRVFSEVMRDVDLFVGVSGIAADPTWQDHGATPGLGEYWSQAAFGDLSVSAQTRREVLETLLPKLRIAARCALEDRFLVVRGDLRTYRIHLGSGNILMEPGSQYLCIVVDRHKPAAAASGKLYLPFEGDLTLSVILSKAFLLAADAQITDRSIVSQIQRQRF